VPDDRRRVALEGAHMRFMVVGICAAALLTPTLWCAVGDKPSGESLEDLYNEYLAYIEGSETLTKMGLPIGEYAPPLEGIDFFACSSVIIFMHHTILHEATYRLVSLFQLMAEWGGISGLQVIAVMSYVGDPKVLTTLQDTAPRTLIVDDRWDIIRSAYNLRLSAGPGLVFYFLDTNGRIAYRWLGPPVFGNAWADFLLIPYDLAKDNAVPADVIMQNHPDNTLGAIARTFEFTDLTGDHVYCLPALGEPAFVYFMRGIPGVEIDSASLVVAELARVFSDRVAFYAVIPDVSAEGLLMAKEVAERGLITDPVAQEAEDLLGPLPSTPEEIEEWLDALRTTVTLPPMLKAQNALGIPVLRDTASQALFTWGVSLFGYRTFLLLDDSGHILAFGPIEVAFEPLYAQWLEEVSSDTE